LGSNQTAKSNTNFLFNASDNTLRIKLKAITETVVVTSTSGTVNLDLTAANIFQHTSNGGNTTFTFSNPPASGTAQYFTVIFIQDGTGGRTLTWPATAKWTDGQTPVYTTTANAVDVFTFITVNGGTTYLGSFAMADVK